MTYIAGLGTKLGILIGSTVTDIGQMVNITPPKMTHGDIETTHLQSTWKEFLAAIPEGGEVSFTVEWQPKNTVHAQLWTSFQAGTKEAWTVTFSDLGATATLVTFGGYIKDFPWDQIDVEKVVTIQFNIKISGAVTITPAT